jgi:hypothetical protein
MSVIASLSDIRPNIYLLFIADFWKYGMIQEETNRILYQSRQNGWSKKSIYTLKLLPKPTKQITKCRHFRSMRSSKRRKLTTLGNVSFCLYVRASAAVLRYAAGSVPGMLGGEGVLSYLCATYIKWRPWEATDIIYLNRAVDNSGRNWYAQSTDLESQLMRFLDHRTQLLRLTSPQG